jgi:hypothetical protein
LSGNLPKPKTSFFLISLKNKLSYEKGGQLMEITDEFEFLARPRKKPKGNKPLKRINLRETADIRLFFVSRRIPFLRLAKVRGKSVLAADSQVEGLMQIDDCEQGSPL